MTRFSLRLIAYACLGILPGILFYSCASTSLPYPGEVALSTEPFLSRGNVFSGRAPQGWFCASQDTLAEGLAAWVVREDFGAALAVKELHLDALSAQRVQKEGMNLLASISLSFQRGGKKGSEIELQPKEFTLKNRTYAGYEYREGTTHKRVLVFSAGGRYYECAAASMKGSWSAEEVTKLFTIQQAFVGSLAF